MYLEERVEQLEATNWRVEGSKAKWKLSNTSSICRKNELFKSISVKMTQNGDVKVIRLGKLVRIPMSQFEKEENKEKAWKDVVFKGA